MPGYLDQYGAGEESRNRVIIRAIVITLSALVIGSLGWYLLKNHHQEGVVKSFVGALRRGDYQAAYRRLGLHYGKTLLGIRLQQVHGGLGPESVRFDR